MDVVVKTVTVQPEKHNHRCPLCCRLLCRERKNKNDNPTPLVYEEKEVDADEVKWTCKGRCIREEENVVCQKTLAGTGLEYHVYPCRYCLNSWYIRSELDALEDVFLSAADIARYTEVHGGEKSG